MRTTAMFITFFALILLFVPMIALGFEDIIPAKITTVSAPEIVNVPEEIAPVITPEISETEVALDDIPPEIENTSSNGVLEFSILDETTGRVAKVSLRDFLRGAVAAEMPVTFHPEALKAQAVAAHTYALHNHYLQQKNPDPNLKGADFSADPSNMLVYITEKKAREFYGDNADLYWDKICTAADSVSQYILEYNNEPIVAAYHAISAGTTEDAANIWSGNAPYLMPAISEGDLLAPDYETKSIITSKELSTILQNAYPDIELSANPAEWLNIIEVSDSGYITEIDLSGIAVHGKDIRSLLGLRSHNMDINYNADADSFTFIVRGYGHGVGLSQYGADFMARQGSTFDEILKNYYTDVNLVEILSL